ncbi:MAG: corrinoid protein [Calditrichaeota bacterium]|nr:corrinoid protein [Calditrichota bacterium]MBT7615940.1 corrinoid protein [Calditrichota bacterium]
MHIYDKLAKAVVEMKAAEVKLLALQVLDEGFPPDEAIQKGLAVGMQEVGRLFSCKDYFVPEVLVSARAMYTGFNILKPKVIEGAVADKGTILIGVVEGDYHDIGKNIVKLMLEASGFRLVDLGKNVSVDAFTRAVVEEKPAIAAMSTLMTTTMDSMEEIVVRLTKDAPEVKIMIGGAPVNQDFADSIGAHFYGDDVDQAIVGAHKLLGIKA